MRSCTAIVYKDTWQHFRRRAQQNLVEGVGIDGRLWAHVDGADVSLVRDPDESRGGIDRARRADNDQDRGAIELAVDTFHVERDFPEPDDVRTNGSAALWACGKVGRGFVERCVREGHIAVHASRLKEGSVHVMDAAGTSALVEVIDVLGAEIEAVA